MARDGSVGRETFKKVEALTKKGMSKSDAFKQVAAETGRNIGTVSANYYRVARANGAVKPRRRPAKATTSPRAPRQSTRRSASRNGSDIDRLTADLVKSVQALADQVKSEQREIIQLRERLAGVAKAIG